MNRVLSLTLVSFLASLSSTAPLLAAPLAGPPPQPPLFPVSAFDAAPDPRLNNAYKFNEGGWTYVHLQGTPEQIGFQHGYLLAREIEDNVHVYTVTAPQLERRPWTFFREAGRTILWPHLDSEYQEELKGIAEGLKAQGAKLDLWDIVALNGDIELSEYYLPTLNKKEGKPNPPAAVAPGNAARLSPPDRQQKMARLSSPIATGLRMRRANAGPWSSMSSHPADSTSSWTVCPASSRARTTLALTPAAS